MSKGQENRVMLTVVVSGTPTEVETNLNATLSEVAKKAINQVGSKEKDLDKWKLTDSNKNELSFDQKVGEAGLQNGSTVFLDQRAGITG